VAEENYSCVMARQDHKQKCKEEDGTEGHGEHHQEEKTVVDRARVAHGQG